MEKYTLNAFSDNIDKIKAALGEEDFTTFLKLLLTAKSSDELDEYETKLLKNTDAGIELAFIIRDIIDIKFGTFIGPFKGLESLTIY